jgi:hypothetical protein
LGVLYGGLGISKLQVLIKKIKIKFLVVNFFPILDHQTLDLDPGSGIRIRDPDPQLEKMPDPDPHLINTDSKPCLPGKKLLICDNLSSQVSLEVISLCRENNIE